MAYITSGAIGARVNSQSTPEFALGTRVHGTDNQIWVYVKCAAAIPICAWVAIDEDFNARVLTVALATRACQLGVALVGSANADYVFVAVSGANINALVDGSTDINIANPLAPSATAGNVAIYSTTTQIKLAGVMLTATVSAGASTTAEVLLTNPVTILV